MSWNSYIDLYNQIVNKNPEKTALIQGDYRVSYRELAGASDLIAETLLKNGIKKGQIVPIILRRSPGTFAALIGIWKAGAAAVVINIVFPPDRINEMCRQCGSDLVIDEAWMQNLDPFAKAAHSAGMPPVNLELPNLKQDDLALVVFTSGSTGGPKGVLIPHRAVTYRAEFVRKGFVEEYGLSENDILLSIVPLSSVVILANEMPFLTVGGAVDIIPSELLQDMSKVIGYGLAHKITYAFAPPLLCPAFMKHFTAHLKFLCTGSERVSNLYSDNLILLNCYGATETAATVCYLKIERAYEVTPVGKPPAGTNMYLLDSDGKQAAQGEVGELCVSGECVALGYLNDSKLTAEKFIANPFSSDEKHKTMYRTGDLFRLNDEGNYEYIQRADWMLKVAGNRVEPGEIENAMCKVAPLTKAVVVGFESRAGAVAQTRLYACYTAAEQIDPKKIQEDISRILPYYMVPSFMEQVPSLPLNVNNKIDRSKIVPPEIEYFKADYEPPANDMEKSICNVFQEMLNIPRVGALDNFLLIGGDSVTAAKAAFVLCGTTGITVTDVLLHQTPRALAALAASKAKELDSAAAKEKINENNISHIFTLSPYQEILFNEWQMNPERYDYNIVEDNNFIGEVSVQRLNDSLIRFFNDYYFLNSSVAVENDIPCWKNKGVISKDAQIVQYFDHPLDDKQIFSLVSKPFDLTKDQLYRYILIKPADRKYRYIVCGHHIVIDGTKARAIHEEYAAYYNNPDYSAAVDKDKQKILYSGFLSTLQTLMDENKKNMTDFWRGYCSDAQPVDLKFLCRSAGAPQEQESLSAVSICNFVIDQKDTNRVKIISQKYGITPYMYSKIIFALSLYRMSGQSNISFSYPVAVSEGLALMYGSQVNTMLIKFSFNRETTIEDLIQQTKNFYSEAEKNKARYLPLNETIEFLPERKMPEINFAHSVQRYSKFGFNGVEKETVNLDFLFDISYTLLIQMEEQSNRLLFEFKYKNRILDGALVRKFSGVYQKLFCDILNGLLNEKK